MDVQLQELIDKIKSDGVEQARVKAEQMIAEAKQASNQFRQDASKEAAGIIEQAKADADRSVKAGTEALSQAGRDLILGLKGEVESLFSRVVEEETAAAMKGDLLESAVLKVLDSILQSGTESAELILNPSDVGELSATLKSKLAAKVKGGIPIRASSRISSGFRVSVDNGVAFYDFTPAQIADVLSTFLNPTIAEIVTGQTKSEE